LRGQVAPPCCCLKTNREKRSQINEETSQTF
jgi:hypothetical protein